MLRIDIWPGAQRFLNGISAKHKRQVAAKIMFLAENPHPPKSKQLAGYAPLRKYRVGKYRIVYFVQNNELKIPLIDLRNDDKIYKMVGNKF